MATADNQRTRLAKQDTYSDFSVVLLWCVRR